MKYNPDIHRRRSIRLRDYDYSQAGLYFIAICTQNRMCLFGKIENGAGVNGIKNGTGANGIKNGTGANGIKNGVGATLAVAQIRVTV